MQTALLLDRFYAALKAADAQALAQCVHGDFELDWQGTARIPWAGVWRGVDGLLAFFKTLDTHVQVLDVQRLQSASSDAATFVLLRGRWRMRRDGAELTALAANVFEFADDRIRRYTVLNNTAAFADALSG